MKDMLAVLFGIQTVNAVDQYREGKAIQRSLQDRLELMKWAQKHHNLMRKYREERFAPVARSYALRVWSGIDPANRLRPDLREGQTDGGRAVGADREAVEISNDVVHLYAADLAAGSVRRYVAALHGVDYASDEKLAADHAQYDRWVSDLRARYGPAVDAVFEAYNSIFLAHHKLHEIRMNVGLISKDPEAEDDPAWDEWVLDDQVALGESDWQELFRRDALQRESRRPK